MSDKSTLSLNDLINLHYRQIDIVHKLWNYIWVAGAAVITVSVNYKQLTAYMIAGFIPFALANARLVFLAQREAYLSAQAVKSLARTANPSLPEAVAPVIDAMAPWPAQSIAKGHIAMTAFVVIALAVRLTA